MNQQEQSVYNSGYKCRDNRGKVIKCPYGFNQMKLKHHWLAGWHDSDMAHGVRVTNF